MANLFLTEKQRILVDSLLESWEEAVLRGEYPDPDDFCRENPEIKAAFLKEVGVLKATGWMESPPGLKTNPDITFQIGESIIPGYTLDQVIGAGGYGTVWRAIGPGGVSVALKCVWLGREKSQSEWSGLSLLKEIRHPNLLGLFGFWVVDGWLVIGSELADCTLADAFETEKKQGRSGLQPGYLIPLMRDAADGLDYLHQLPKALIHGDIKPGNLLLVGGRCKVGDFGLIQRAAKTGIQFGGGLTYRFAPPEAVAGKPVTQSDQYSLAMTYCLMRGIDPVSVEGLGEWQNRLAGSWQSPKECAVLAKALAREPQQRFKSCREFVDQLQNSLGRENPVGENQWAVAQQTGKWTSLGLMVTTIAALVAWLPKVGDRIGGIDHLPNPQARGIRFPLRDERRQEDQVAFQNKPVFSNPDRVEMNPGDALAFEFEVKGAKPVGFSLAEMEWIGPDGNDRTLLGEVLPEGVTFSPATGKLAGKMKPGIFACQVVAKLESGETIGQKFTWGTRQNKSLVLSFQKELRIVREGDFLVAYGGNPEKPVARHYSDWITSIRFEGSKEDDCLIVDLTGGGLSPCPVSVEGAEGKNRVRIIGDNGGSPLDIIQTLGKSGKCQLGPTSFEINSIQSLDIACTARLLEVRLLAGEVPVALSSVLKGTGRKPFGKLEVANQPVLAFSMPELLRLRGDGATRMKLKGPAPEFTTPGSLDFTGMSSLEIHQSLFAGKDLDLFSNTVLDASGVSLKAGGHITATGHSLASIGEVEAGQPVALGSGMGSVLLNTNGKVASLHSAVTISAEGPIFLAGKVEAMANVDLIGRSPHQNAITASQGTVIFSNNDRVTIRSNGGTRLGNSTVTARTQVSMESSGTIVCETVVAGDFYSAGKALEALGDLMATGHIHLKHSGEMVAKRKVQAQKMVMECDGPSGGIRFENGAKLEWTVPQGHEANDPFLTLNGQSGKVITFEKGSEINLKIQGGQKPNDQISVLEIAKNIGGTIEMPPDMKIQVNGSNRKLVGRLMGGNLLLVEMPPAN